MAKRGRKARKAKKPRKPPLRLEWIEAGSLADNPANWRRHPEGQVRALKTALDQVGWCGCLLFNETTGHLIDGHLRKAAVGPRTAVPVLVGRWTAEQERTILASLDPLASMAVADVSALEDLLAEADLEADGLEDLAAMLDAMVDEPRRTSGPGRRGAEDAEGGKGKKAKRKRGPRMMRFTLGQFTFEVDRQAYDAWLSAVEAKTGSDVDRIVKELKRRLKL